MNFRNIILAAVFLSIAAIADGQPKDWANFGRYRQQNEEIAGQKINAVFMGNSITDNWARMDPGFFSDHGFVGRGISGQTTSEMLVRFRRDVLDLKPEAVAILAGINDIAQNNGEISLENTFGNIVSMCELAKAHKIKVILCSVLPCDRLSWRPSIQPAQKVRRLNAMLKEYAEENSNGKRQRRSGQGHFQRRLPSDNRRLQDNGGHLPRDRKEIPLVRLVRPVTIGITEKNH